MTQNQQPQLSEERMSALRALIGQEVFCISYTLEGDGTIEVMNVADVMASPEGTPINMLLAGRPWRAHTLGVDAFIDLNEAAERLEKLRVEKVNELRNKADRLVAMQFKAPEEKVKEAQARAEAARKQAQAKVQDVEPKPVVIVKKPAVKKSAARANK